MPQSSRKHQDFRFRAKLPQYVRGFALIAMAAAVAIVAIGFYRERNKPTFKLRSEHTQLSNEVIAEITGYERLETEGDLAKYYVKADKARTYSDNHQELENVFIEIYDNTGSPADKLRAAKALYIPEENKNFTAYLSGDVKLETRDSLKVATEHIVYSKRSETAEADEAVRFSRNNIAGRSFGALINVLDKRIELEKDVEIEVAESSDASHGPRQAFLKSGWAAYDQGRQTIELRGGVEATVHRNSGDAPEQTIAARADRAVAVIIPPASEGGGQPQFSKLEVFENVAITSAQSGGSTTTIRAGYGNYDKPADRFHLRDAVHIITTQNGDPADIRAFQAVYSQGAGTVELSGGAEIGQGINYLRGNLVTATLNRERRLRNAQVRGDGFIRQNSPDRTLHASAAEMSADFGEDSQLRVATAVGNAAAELVPARPEDYTKARLTTPRSIRLQFRGAGALDNMRADGRTTIYLSAPDGQPDAANKRVTADAISTFFDDGGKHIRRAEAVGNAELYVEPLQPAPETFRTTVTAARFDCEFYPAGNNARLCIGGTKTRTVRVPTVAAASRGDQVLTADRVSAAFDQRSKDVERLDADGNAKFTELDRNAVASTISYTRSDRSVRLRGGEPTAWDSVARVKAAEIDWDTSGQKSFLRGGVSTTYYSRRQMNDSAPFGDSDKPVFVTSQSAEFDHREETGTYVGNARGWQGNNYVRADRLLIRQREGQFVGEGNVQSLLYDSRQKRRGADATVPVYASAATMTYSRDSRILSYRNSVDIRQGTDRILAGSADVFLNEKNEVARTVAETSVVITQPGRRAAGDWVQYTADEEVAVLRGSPARVEDAENGASQGAQISVYMRDNRVVGESKAGPSSSGRIRSVYKVRNAQ